MTSEEATALVSTLTRAAETLGIFRGTSADISDEEEEQARASVEAAERRLVEALTKVANDTPADVQSVMNQAEK